MFRAGLLLIIKRINSVMLTIPIAVYDPPDDEQQACSKHVQAYYRNTLI
jgi:hypothetical protein